jgi:hypothetical protein
MEADGTASDTENGNVVRDTEGNVLNGFGHAVFFDAPAKSFDIHAKAKEPKAIDTTIYYISNMRYIILLAFCASFSFAQSLSLGKPKEEKEHSPWVNAGIGVGILNPVSSPSYERQGKAFVNPSFLLGFQFAELSAVTFEVDGTTPDGGLGFWLGFEQQFIQSQITPFAELQIGARDAGSEKRAYKFGDVFGVASSLNGGIIFFRESQFRIRLKGGYELICNKDYDMSWNAEVGFLFAIGRAGLETIKVD